MPSLVEYKGYRSCHARKLAQGYLPHKQPSRVRSGLRIRAVLSMPSLVEYKVIVEVMLESWRRVAYCLYNHRGSGRACAAARSSVPSLVEYKGCSSGRACKPKTSLAEIYYLMS